LEIGRLISEKNDIHNQSVHIVEQSEQRQQKIRHLEAVRYYLMFYLQFIFNAVNGQTS